MRQMNILYMHISKDNIVKEMESECEENGAK